MKKGLVLALCIVFIGCFSSHLTTSNDAGLQDDLTAQDDISTDNLIIDSEVNCRSFNPTILYVTVDTSTCQGDVSEPYITVTINEVSPYCTPVSEWYEEVNIDSETSTIEIVPYATVCTNNWELCEPGDMNTTQVRIDVEQDKEYTITVFNTDFEQTIYCNSSTACNDYYLPLYYPIQYFPDLIFEDDRNISVGFSSYRCGCTEFYEPEIIVNEIFDERGAIEHRYARAIVTIRDLGTICEEECCNFCDCIDIKDFDITLPVIFDQRQRGVFELYFPENLYFGVYTKIVGIVMFPTEDELPTERDYWHTLSISEVRIDKEIYWIGIDQEVVLEVTIQDESLCNCPEVLGVAYNVEYTIQQAQTKGTISLFSLGNDLCLDIAPCEQPPEPFTFIVKIPLDILIPGEYDVVARDFYSYFGSFSVYDRN